LETPAGVLGPEHEPRSRCPQIPPVR
jgi:hypothetical protein